MVQCLLDHGANAAALNEEYSTTPLIWAKTAHEVTNNPDCYAVAAPLEGHTTVEQTDVK